MKERPARNTSQPASHTALHPPLSGVARSRSPALQPGSLLYLQRAIGNRAVVRHLAGGNRVQRAADTGLAALALRGRFASHMNTWRNEHIATEPPVMVYILIDEAFEQAQAILTEMGIPQVSKVLDPQAPGSLDGQFRAKEWSLLLNPEMAGPLNTPLSAVTGEQQSRIVSVVYHEIRHCEQYFNMARFLAGTGVEAGEIATAMDIPAHVAQAAHANPLNMVVTNGLPFLGGGVPSISAEYFEAWQWYRQVYGKLGKYTTGVYDTLRDIWKLRSNLNQVIADPARADIAFENDTLIEAWRDVRIPTLFEAYKASLEASSFNFAMDEQALRDINRILPVIRGFIDLWAQSPGDFAGQKRELARVNDAVEQAYEALLTEKDAHTLGDQVTDTFKTLAGI